DDVRGLGPRDLEATRAVRRLEHLHPLRLQVHPAEKPDRSLVVDYEDLGHGPRRRPQASKPSAAIPIAQRPHSTLVVTGLRASGSSNQKRDPRPACDATSMCPPIASTRPRAMKRPRP